VTGAADRRAAVMFLMTRWELSERAACALAGISRSALVYQSRRKDERVLVKALKALARRHPRYG
jgi:putative transposase